MTRARARSPRSRRKVVAKVALAVVLVPPALLAIHAARTPIPAALDAASLAGASGGEKERRGSVKIVDRTGVVLAELRDEQGMRARRLALSDFGPDLERAVLAAEDARFYEHPGIDPLALARAAVSSAAAGRLVSGASTLTQQLARTLLGAPRTLRGKIDVMALALKLEATFTKRRILEEYLNRVEFGPNVRGAEAAAWTYFGKPSRSLSLAESAALASIPRGPTLYDPRRKTNGYDDNEALRARRDRVLERMADKGLAARPEVDRAKAEPIVVGGRFRSGSAPHFVAALERGIVDPCGARIELPRDAAVVRSTLIADLQLEIEQAARHLVGELSDKRVTAASVVVLDNRTGDVLAYLGSPDASDAKHLGANDGTLAKRQPGSTLKPFVYELGMEKLGLTPASMLPDVEMSFVAYDGEPFRPQNYDHRFHGPVLLREALGNSLNVPAVWLTERLGAGAVLDRLRAAGFCSLSGPPSRYGVGVALGDGEVTLFELATAYASLARGGAHVTPRAVIDVELANGDVVPMPAAPTAASDPASKAAFVTDILADPRARASSFGDSTVFDLPFVVAAKTGTSKGFRDNWAVGYTAGLTVAVWVGNFDGSPMRDVSGIAGAGPLFRAAMLAASRYVPPSELSRPDADVVEICPLSGRRATARCPHRAREIVPRGADVSDCDMHVELRVDPSTNERAGPACDPSTTEKRVFEAFPPLLVPWARAARRDLAPETYSARCPGPEGVASNALRILYPEDGARFFLTPGEASHIEARSAFTPGPLGRVFVLDGRSIPMDDQGRALLELAPGSHSLAAREGDRTSEIVHFTVE